MTWLGMEILSVTLKNFKTHKDRYFEFQPGTNAICGENGAGKTSILEAIAWVLFNYQGDYGKDDLIRNGSGSAQVTVTMISSRDSRTYQVQRCTQRGYTIYDPQLDSRLPYSRIKDEVLPWLRQHMGIAAGTDLAQLFARTLGVPQGTFTADFLLTVESRKAVFDAVLKVEEYKAAFKQMNGLRRYAEAQVETVKHAIAQYNESLATWDELQHQVQTLQTEIEADEQQQQALEAILKELTAQRQALQQQAQQLQTRQQQIQELTTQQTSKTQLQVRLQQSLEQAAQARETLDEQRPAYEGYQAAEAQLQALNQQQQARQNIQQQYQQQLKQQERRQQEQVRLRVQMEALAGNEQALEQLRPLAQKQVALTAQLNGLQQQQQTLQQIRLERQHLNQQQASGQKQQQDLERKTHKLQALRAPVAEIVTLEQQRDRYQQQLSHLEAGQQFEAELRRLVTTGTEQCDSYQAQAQAALTALTALRESVPLLATDGLEELERAIATGVQINQAFLESLDQILQDLAAQTDGQQLRHQLKQVQQTLDQRYQQRGELAQLTTVEQQLAQLGESQAHLQEQIGQLTEQLTAEADLQAQIADLSATLAALDNPQAQVALLEKGLQEKAQLQAAYDRAVAAQAQFQQQLIDLETQLATFAELDQQVAEQQGLRQAHQPGYTLYLQSQQAAAAYPQLVADLEAVAAELTQLDNRLATTQAEYEQQRQAFDPEQQAAVEASFNETKAQSDRLAGSLPQQRKLLANLEKQIAALQDIATKRQQAEQERKQRERIRRFVNFARKVYKEAGPRITERYVQSISYEADRLFRELLNRPNVALTWTRDYEILVQEGANQRRFINLSGGEQMCAALAVRLALLKVLADVDIAFFDEPTTNMDRPRRESLAEAINRIKSFRQLFVISHDDTFEKVTENVIVVERMND